MLKNNWIKLITLIAALFVIVMHFFSFGEVEKPFNSQNDDKIIEKLIKTIGDSNLKFIRNGSSYTSKEAASHLQLKLEIANKKKINSKTTVCEFINNIASKSSLSGLPYEIEIENGKKCF